MAAPPAIQAGANPVRVPRSGPDSMTIPAMARTIPTPTVSDGAWPVRMAMITGTSTLSAAIGETTPMVPIARAR